MMPARTLVLIFILASSHVVRFIAQYPAGPKGPAESFSYGLVGVDGAATAAGATAATGAAAATGVAAATIGDEAGANIGPDFHVTSFHVLRMMRVIPRTVRPTE